MDNKNKISETYRTGSWRDCEYLVKPRENIYHANKVGLQEFSQMDFSD